MLKGMKHTRNITSGIPMVSLCVIVSFCIPITSGIPMVSLCVKKPKDKGLSNALKLPKKEEYLW
ncbi:hypothetical protein M8C21_024572 [Ambrosia artemisiifolia]|uniref:Uncharacterized protein n=1 Tax=Ambrosia artemisiifolia TaxID=4212 RepID=A0AAD5G5G2_AMBAR|nr:hypothetical protein M8C21_024572 [Ambrosia artemisiifolia]